jgi:hypothetical protein
MISSESAFDAGGSGLFYYVLCLSPAGRGISGPFMHPQSGLKNIDRKLTALRERGFSDPQKLVESSPPILGYAIENIDAKLQHLAERGFVNPRRMVESFPPDIRLWR